MLVGLCHTTYRLAGLWLFDDRVIRPSMHIALLNLKQTKMKQINPICGKRNGQINEILIIQIVQSEHLVELNTIVQEGQLYSYEPRRRCQCTSL